MPGLGLAKLKLAQVVLSALLLSGIAALVVHPSASGRAPDPTYQHVTSWTYAGGSVPVFSVALGGDGTVFVSGADGYIRQYDLSGGLLSEIAVPGLHPDPATYGVLSLAFDSSGNIHAGGVFGDPPRPMVRVFKRDGTFIRQYRVPDTEANQYWYPGSIAVNALGESYVGSPTYSVSNVTKFAADGSVIATFGGYGKGPGQFRGVSDVDVAPDGSIYVADAYRVQHLSSSGTYLGEWGGLNNQYRAGKFQNPLASLAVGHDGHVFVSDSVRVHEFTADGAFVTDVGQGELFSTDIAANDAGQVFAVGPQPSGGTLIAAYAPDLTSIRPAILSNTIRVVDGQARVKVACRSASDCAGRGTITMRNTPKTLAAKGAYIVKHETTKVIKLRLTDVGKRALAAKGVLRVVVLLTSNDGVRVRLKTILKQ